MDSQDLSEVVQTGDRLPLGMVGDADLLGEAQIMASPVFDGEKLIDGDEQQ